MNDFQVYLKEKTDFFETELKRELKELSYPETIAKGMEYATLNGGKRLRPFLLFATLELLNENIKKGVKSAIALEMIHSYSLVHDDLPALDNDDYRRGKLTTHKVFGEAEGILIGDSLLTYAFYVLSQKNLEFLSFSTLAMIQAISIGSLISFPVLWLWIYFKVSKPIFLFSLSISIICPPIIPFIPAYSEVFEMIFTICSEDNNSKFF